MRTVTMNAVPQPKRRNALDSAFVVSKAPMSTGAILRVVPAVRDYELLRRIRAEFLEMPGLCLTMRQALRLWLMEPLVGEALLNSLLRSRFLRRDAQGLFVLNARRR